MKPEQRKYTIAKPTVEDAEELTAMHGQSWLDAYPSEEHGISVAQIKESVDRRATKEGLEKRRGYITKTHTNPDYFLRIARDSENAIVGFVDGRPHNKGFELNGLYVAKSEYGTGLAMQLWQEFLRWAGTDRDVILSVVAYNQRARAFYSKIGFKTVPGTKRPHQSGMPIIDMIRKAQK
jgi:ribosomal protein S18 acetylase RimI-like enzyme